jgi:hypothetical protein
MLGAVLRSIFSIVLVLVLGALPAMAERRLAFVVGNDNYQNVPSLLKARNDAGSIAQALKALDFQVDLHTDLDRAGLSKALNAFESKLQKDDVAFVFFSGHGFEIRGINYLLPTDVPAAGPGQESVVKDSAFDADEVISRLQLKGTRVAIAVIDACRDNPFAGEGMKSVTGGRGLAQMTPAEGVFILMSAGARQMALDRLSDDDKDPNSVFTRFFIRELKKPGQTLVQVAKRTQVEVRKLAKTVGFDQTPAYYDQVIGDVVLAKTDAPVAIEAPKTAEGFTNPTVTTNQNTLVSPNVTLGQGVTIGEGVLINGKPAQLLLQGQAGGTLQGQGADANPAQKPQSLAALMPQPSPGSEALNNPGPQPPGTTTAAAPLATFMRSNQGWSATISLGEPALSVSYRVGEKGDFIDMPLLSYIDQRTGARMPDTTFSMAGGQKPTTIEVKYLTAEGREVGPFPIAFDPDVALYDMQKKVLEQLWPSWVAFREYDGMLIYFTTLISYRCAIAEVRYGLNDAEPLKRYDLPKCNTKDPFSVPDTAKIWQKVPGDTVAVNIEITWRDGTKSGVKRIERE